MRDQRTSLLLTALPIHMTLACILVISLESISFRLLHDAPVGPWESGLIMEGVRSLHGLPVYEDAASGHATAMYGPLMPHVLGALYRPFGVHVETGRALNLLAALLLAVLVSRVLSHKATGWGVAAGIVLLLGVHNKALEFTTATRPDMIACLMGGLGLVLLARGFENRSARTYGIGVLAIVIGFLFKQTAAIFAVVPLIAIASYRDATIRTRLAHAAAPISAIVITALTIQLFFPYVSHYMFWIPSKYALHLAEYPAYLFGLVASCSLFVCLFLDWLMRSREETLRVEMRWLLAALAVLVPGSVLFLSKVGGDANSIYPALVCMIGFCLAQQHVVAQRIAALRPVRRVAASSFLALLMFVSVIPINSVYWQSRFLSGSPALVDRFTRRESGEDYRQIVEFVRAQPGRTLSLDDPTITYFAKGILGRSMAFEMDNVPQGGTYGREIPFYVAEDVRSADTIVSVRTWSPYPESSRAFQLEPRFVLTKSFGAYQVWQKP